MKAWVPAAGSASGLAVPVLSIVVPTLDEQANIGILFDRVALVLGNTAWEMIVVDDDSMDGTAGWVKRRAATDPRLRCLRRVGRRGLAGACIEGILSSSSPAVAVIDGDLQHDEAILNEMLRRLLAREADLVIGTRRRRGASIDALGRPRRWLSDGGKALSRLVLSRDVSDPMSGFFMVRRDLVEDIAPSLATDGFKVLFDILSHMPRDAAVAEVGYDFRGRHAGSSKLDARVLLDYLDLVLRRLSGDLVPTRTTTYLLAGSLGLLGHLAILHGLVYFTPGLGFRGMEVVASCGSIPLCFVLDDVLTSRRRRSKGWAMLPALALFGGLCGVGVPADLGASSWMLEDASTWWRAGLLGALVGTCWNCAIGGSVVWSSGSAVKRRPRRGSGAPASGTARTGVGDA